VIQYRLVEDEQPEGIGRAVREATVVREPQIPPVPSGIRIVYPYGAGAR